MLGPLRTDARLVKALNNIRVRCAVSLVGRDGAEKACERGEVLFRDYGVSGIAVFNLSRFAEPGDTLRIDLLPQHGEAPLEELLRARLASLRERGGAGTGDDALRGMMLPAVGRAVLKAAGLHAESRSRSATCRRSSARSRDSRSRCAASARRGSARCTAAGSSWRRSIRARARRERCRVCTWWARRSTWTRPAEATTCTGRGRAACWRVAPPRRA